MQLGKYSTDRDNILHFLCTSEWSNDSFGNVEAPTGYVWRISNNRDDIFGCFDQGNSEFDSVIEDQLKAYDIEDTEDFRKSLVGHFLITEDSNGYVSVHEYPTEALLLQAYESLEEIFSQWDTQEDD